MSFWADACSSAVSRTLQEVVDTVHIVSGLTVAAFCVCAIASGIMHVRWRRLSEQNRRQLWRLYVAPVMRNRLLLTCAQVRVVYRADVLRRLRWGRGMVCEHAGSFYIVRGTIL